MRKRFFILNGLAALALLLAACSSSGGQGSGTSVPGGAGTGVPGTVGTGMPGAVGTGTAVIPNTGGTAAASPEVTQAMSTATAPAASTPMATAGSTSMPAVTNAPVATQAVTGTASAGGSTPSAQGTSAPGLIGIPQTGANGAVGLAAMNGWRVVDTQGNEIGTVQDYVLNMCEAHILYMVVSPTSGSGGQVLIPYEATLEKLNKGKVDASQGVITVDQPASDLASVPTVNINSVDLQTAGWDTALMAYWKAKFSLSLTTGCSVPMHNATPAVGAGTAAPTTGAGAAATQPSVTQAAGTPGANATPSGSRQNIQRIALASKVLNADLKDGNGKLLGTLKDIAIVPQSGWMQYLLVDASQGQNSSSGSLVALPAGAVNVQYADGSAQPNLVLLVDTSVMQSAPAYTPGFNANDKTWFDYWNQYLPMTKEQLP